MVGNNPSATSRYKKSMELFGRAAEVIPGGIYGHTSPAVSLPLASPYYAAKGKGSRYWDVDGNEFIDYMCGYGPIVLGYNHEETDEVARKQMEDGNCFNHPGPMMVELAEKMVDLVDFADWAVFAKNGSDVTTWSLQVAREFTGRKKIGHVAGAYHGIDPWCTPGHGGLIEEDRMHIHTYQWNNIQSFHEMLNAHPDQFAAIITTPYHHPAFADSVLPEPGFLQEIEKTCREKGILLICDDIRAGFRLNIGGSHRHFDFTPDMICFCKALGNGWPISAALGRKDLKVAASKVFLTGSYWGSAIPMAVALRTLEILQRDHGIAHMEKVGTRLMNGLEEKAQAHGLKAITSGPPAVPFMRMDNDPNLKLQQRVCTLAMERGAFLHPHHNWFVSTAHSEADIDETLHIADEVFQLAAKDLQEI